VALSQSGETPEIVDVLGRLERAGAHGIATTNDAGSALAQAADAVVALGDLERLPDQVAGLLGRGLDPDSPRGLSKVTPTR
jgi:fructoselysine-6-P-deglycase FrlB-like protein